MRRFERSLKNYGFISDFIACKAFVSQVFILMHNKGTMEYRSGYRLAKEVSHTQPMWMLDTKV